VGFEPTPPKRLVPETSALDHSATLPPDDKSWAVLQIWNVRTNAGLCDEYTLSCMLLLARILARQLDAHLRGLDVDN
jgi:hypothetical protein